MQRSILVMVACLVVSFTITQPATAGFTTVGGSNEQNHIQILSTLYGGSFSGSALFGAPTYTNGTVSAIRVHDFDVGSPLHLQNGSTLTANDQVWADGVVTASAEARFAGYDQAFGYDPGADGGYVNLFDVTGSGYNVSGGIGNFLFGGTFAFARDGQNGPHFSKNSLNSDQSDHMLTYEITGLGQKMWLLFFEDKSQPFSDRDFNDLVIQMQVQIVSAPGAVVLAGIGIVLVATMARKRKSVVS